MLSGCLKIIPSTYNTVKQEIATLGKVAQSTEGFDKFAKFVVGVIDCSRYIIGDVLLPFHAPLKNFTVLTGGLNSINRVNDLLDEKKRPKTAIQWTKYITLSIGHGLETIKFLASIDLIKLGSFASQTCSIGIFRIPGISLMKDLSIGVSAICGIVINTKNLKNPSRPLREEGIKYKIKHFKFKSKMLQIAQEQGSQKKIALLKAKSEVNRIKFVAYDEQFGDVLRSDRDRKHFFAYSGTPAEKNNFEQEFDTSKWSLDFWKTSLKSHSTEGKKARWGISNDFFKLGLIALSVGTLFFAFSTLLPGFAVFGLAAGYTGYRKFCIDSNKIEFPFKPNFNLIN